MIVATHQLTPPSVAWPGRTTSRQRKRHYPLAPTDDQIASTDAYRFLTGLHRSIGRLVISCIRKSEDGTVRLSKHQIAKRVGCSPRTVQRAYQPLVDSGLIEIYETQNERGGDARHQFQLGALSLSLKQRKQRTESPNLGGDTEGRKTLRASQYLADHPATKTETSSAPRALSASARGRDDEAKARASASGRSARHHRVSQVEKTQPNAGQSGYSGGDKKTVLHLDKTPHSYCRSENFEVKNREAPVSRFSGVFSSRSDRKFRAPFRSTLHDRICDSIPQDRLSAVDRRTLLRLSKECPEPWGPAFVEIARHVGQLEWARYRGALIRQTLVDAMVEYGHGRDVPNEIHQTRSRTARASKQDPIVGRPICADRGGERSGLRLQLRATI